MKIEDAEKEERRGSGTILIVDDDPPVVALGRRYLELVVLRHNICGPDTDCGRVPHRNSPRDISKSRASHGRFSRAGKGIGPEA